MSTLNQLPLILEMGALPLNFQGTPQQFADAIVERMRVVTQQALALFAAGATEPQYNVGLWMDQSSSIGILKGFSNVTGNYQPLPLADVSLRYIVSNTEPDPNVFRLWVKLSNAGEGLGVYTYYNGAWRDVYANVIATLNAAIAAVLPPAGAAGTVLTSAGPNATPVWANQFFPGVIIDYAGSTVPVGLQWLICDGSLKAIVSYPNLFDAIGTQYGGDGLTTFAVPDLRGRGRAGLGTGDAPGATPWALGQKRGSEIHQLITPELPSHVHSLSTLGNGNADGNDNLVNQGVVFNGVGGGGPVGNNTQPTGGDVPHNNISPMMGLTAIIRY